MKIHVQSEKKKWMITKPIALKQHFSSSAMCPALWESFKHFTEKGLIEEIGQLEIQPVLSAMVACLSLQFIFFCLSFL